MLQEKAMIANLTIHSWAAQKTDKEITADVEARHQAKNSGRFSKQLIDKEKLKSVQQAARSISEMHHKRTLPWGDNGDRLLPSAMYFDYRQEMQELTSSFNCKVNLFVHEYPQCVQEARTRLQGMYKPEDYPDPADIRAKFGIDVSFMPVPDAKDFRTDIGKDEVEVIRQRITKQVMQQQESAIKDLWSRLHVVVSKVEERMSTKDAKIYDSLIDNVQETTSLMKKLNLTNDETMNTVIADVEYRICGVHPNQLRGNETARKHLATAARDILTRIPHED